MIISLLFSFEELERESCLYQGGGGKLFSRESPKADVAKVALRNRLCIPISLSEGPTVSPGDRNSRDISDRCRPSPSFLLPRHVTTNQLTFRLVTLSKGGEREKERRGEVSWRPRNSSRPQLIRASRITRFEDSNCGAVGRGKGRGKE